MIKSAIRFLTLFACSVALAMAPMLTSVKAAPNNRPRSFVSANLVLPSNLIRNIRKN